MEYFIGRGEKWKEDDMSKVDSKNPTKNPSQVLKRSKQPKINRKKMKRNRKSLKVANSQKLDIKTFSNSSHSNHRSSTKAKEVDWRRKKRWFNYSMKFLIFMLILVQEFGVGATSNVPIMSTRIVETRYGKLQGMIYPMDHAKHLKPVEVFLGVPYATPPVRSNRFSPTRTPSPWEGVRIADKMGPVCPQKLPGIKNETAALEKMPKGRLEYLKRLLPYLSNQSEDCLYLNIYAPAQTNVNEATRKMFQLFSSRYYDRNTKLHSQEHDDEECDFTPNLHKKAIFENIYQEFNVPFISAHISCCTHPLPSKLTTLWRENLESLLNFVSTANQGIILQIVDENKIPIRNAQVLLKLFENSKRVTSNSAYYKAMVPPGEYYLEISANGFESKVESIFVRKNAIARKVVVLSNQKEAFNDLKHNEFANHVDHQRANNDDFQEVWGMPRMAFIMLMSWLGFSAFCLLIGVAIYCERHQKRHKSEYRFSLLSEKSALEDKENDVFSRPIPGTASQPYYDEEFINDVEDEIKSSSSEELVLIREESKSRRNR